MDTRRILEQFTGHRAGQSRGGLEELLGGLLAGRGGTGGMSAGGMPGGGGPGMGGLGGMLDALAGGSRSSTGASGGGLGGLGGMLNPPMGSGIGAAAAGGLLGSLLGGGRRGGGSGLLRLGGLAILGTLAHRAYQAWQEQQASAAGKAPPPAPPAAAEATPDSAAADNQPFGLAVIRAMIAAAKADGHIDAQERERIFNEVERLELSNEEKGFVFGALEGQADPRAIAALAKTEGQKAQIYLASRLVAEPDTAAERAWMEALAHELRLPGGLQQQLDQQAKDAAAAAAQAGL
ncbi:tellurite resistance TerB family protein [Sabulicella rubraurantiaca]|uniref:tellurite resistance TerB family protein n=1 Tax=Sabulicella rubraurantiaca TaxID=2811429 RepID=UPI001A976379|nr:DUF533 domain-containing protein [Sabulicella rubraurantiaca]